MPTGFESLTSLGPVRAVFEDEGVQILPNFGTPVPSVLVRYHDGFAYRVQAMLARNRKDIHIWRWDEVATIESNIWRRRGQYGSSYAVAEYTLTKRAGEKVVLNDTMKESGGIAHIKEAVFALLEPPLAKRYEAGEALTFGPVTIHRQSGLELDQKNTPGTSSRMST